MLFDRHDFDNMEGLLAVQGVWLRDSPEVGLQGSPVAGVLHFQGMAEQELLVEEPPPQDKPLQGSQTLMTLLVFSAKRDCLSQCFTQVSLLQPVQLAFDRRHWTALAG